MPRPDGKTDKLALAVARGMSLAAAARAVDVPESTARRWAADPAFAARVKAIRDEVTGQTIGALTVLAVNAAATLGELTKDTHSDEIRLRATREILTHFLTVREAADFGERLQALEVRLGGTAHGAKHFEPTGTP